MITGVLVAFGAMSLMSGLIAGVLIAFGMQDAFPGDAVEGTLAAGVLVALMQLLAYLWGGYTAGRMARGAGLANGLLVPLVAILLLIVIGAVVGALVGANVDPGIRSFNVFTAGDVVIEWGVSMAVASLVAMFVGGGLGGLLGTRWHSRLEQEATEPVEMSDTRPPSAPNTP